MALDAERNLDMAFKMTNLFFNGVTSAADVIHSLLEYASSTDPAVKLLRNYMKSGGQLEFTACKPQYEKEFAEKLKDEGVVFLQTKSMANGGVHVFLYADRDREKVEAISNELRAEYGRNGITDHATLYAYAKGNLNEIHNLDRDEALLFSEHAEKRNLKISVDEPSKNTFTVTYAEKDANALNRIKADIAIELSGDAGRALRKQLQYENEKIAKVLDLAKNYDGKNSAYLVDLKGNEMQIDYDGITYQGKDGVITVRKNEPDFAERTDDLVLQMQGPVHLTKEKKEELDHQIDKKSYLVKTEHENGRPAYTEEEYAAIRQMMEKKELYEIKLAIADPEQTVFDICLENDEMRLATFEEFNDINEKTGEVEMNQEIEPELMKEIQGRFRSYIDSPSQLDYEMVDFQEAVLDGREYDMFERDTFDLMHDKNNNLIPDEYEFGNDNI